VPRESNEREHFVERRVWFLWLQGLHDAPEVVRRCYSTWITRNPTWEVVPLDNENLPLWVDDTVLQLASSLTPAAYSDIIRLDLLARRGGVWADATCWCNSSLESWLPEYTDSGFFAFRNPGRDRLLSSWFLASRKDNPLVVALRNALLSYWSTHDFRSGLFWSACSRLLALAISRDTIHTKYWFSSLIQDRIRVSPYYAVHYIFTGLVTNDAQAADIWSRTKVFDARLPHQLQEFGLRSPLTLAARAEIDSPNSPVYKLTHKGIGPNLPNNSVLQYLYSQG